MHEGKDAFPGHGKIQHSPPATRSPPPRAPCHWMSWVLRGSRLSITWGRLRHPPESRQAGGEHRWELLRAFRGDKGDQATPGRIFSPQSTSSPSTNPLPSQEKHPAAWRPARHSESSQMPLNNRQNILLNISAPAQRDEERPRRARAAMRLLPAKRIRRGRSGTGRLFS